MTLRKAFDGEVYYWYEDGKSRQAKSRVTNTMNAEKDKAPERPKRVWITWDDAYPWPTPEMGGDEYVHIDLLATARKEARQAAFREAVDALKAHQQAVRDRHYGVITLAIEAVEALERAATEHGEE